MKKQVFSRPGALHLLQKCLDLVSMRYTRKVGGTAWRLTDLLFGLLRVWLFLEKPSDQVSNKMSLLPSCTLSLLCLSTSFEGNL